MAQYFDKLINEKLPNGDVSQFMTQMNKELSVVKEKGTTEGLTIKDKAHFLAVAKLLISSIEYYTKLWSAEIVKDMNPDTEFDFADLGQIVAIKNGGSLSKIADGIFDELTKDELKKCATVTEKGLKEIGKVDLIKKYKVITGNKANSVMYKSLVTSSKFNPEQI